MAENYRSKERFTGRYSAKVFLVSLTILFLLGTAAWFALTTGLDRLPKKLCAGAVERDVVIRTLPRTRTAEEGYSRRHEGKDLKISCHIYTSADSILSGMVRVNDASPKTWLNHYGDAARHPAVRTSTNSIEALARLDRDSGNSSVYVPCAPRGSRASAAHESYAIVAEASVIGKTRATGTELRQAVTDFAYQLAKHAYELAGCKGSRDFPEKLPRYEGG